jgi:Subtilase family
MIPCKSHDQTGNGTSASVVECMDWYDTLKQRGVDITATNNSWGGCNEACSFDPALRDAITLMWHDDILFVASAGNDNTDNDQVQKYPADYYLPNIIVLAATDYSDQRASFSNYGQRTVTLGAPGVSVYSTMITGAYGYESGTSMSSPHVTGLLALLKAQDPSRDWITLKNLAIAGGEPVTSMQGITVSGLRMNAYNSMTCSNRKVFGMLRPLEDVPRKKHTVSVLNIDCAAPGGHLSVTITPGGQTLKLKDLGTGRDLQAGDGIYSAMWRPSASGTYTFSFSNGQTQMVRVH